VRRQGHKIHVQIPDVDRHLARALRRVDVQQAPRRAHHAAIAAISLTVPISLLACMMLTRQVSGRRRLVHRLRMTRPSASGAR
jgi:hypothetical protein